MKCYVLRGGEQTGPYTATEVQKRLDDGRLSPTDLCWYEGAPDWQPLHRVEAVNSTAEAVALTVVPPATFPLDRPEKRLRPYYSDDHEREKRDEGFNPASGGWICFAVAILGLVCFSYLWLPVACVLFFVVFVLSIVALAKGRVASGAIMLCALVIIGPVAGFIAPLILPGFLEAASNARRVKVSHENTSPELPTTPARDSKLRADKIAETPEPAVEIEAAEASVAPRAAVATPTPAAFLADVAYSQQAAVQKYPALAVAGSTLNKAFIAKLAAWKATHDPRLTRSDWPEVLAGECSTNR